MKIHLISPHLVLSEKDVFTTGIVYMPIALAYLSSLLDKEGLSHDVLDIFGEQPNCFSKKSHLLFRGIPVDELEEKFKSYGLDDIIVIYAINIAAHDSLSLICGLLKKLRPNCKVIALENSQAVTAYSLKEAADELFKCGVDFISTGDLEFSCISLIKALHSHCKIDSIEGIGYFDQSSKKISYIDQKNKNLKMDSLPFPAWSKFPLKNYWKLKYAHGPVQSRKYLPLLTSRGCPYQCRFCVIPGTNDLKWRARTPQNIVDEMDHFHQLYGVTEFHIEDVDPTVNDPRIKEFSQLLIKKGSPYTWKICSGTKVETIKSVETIELMAKAGCNYISISPETGSPRVLKMINKPFNLEHAERLIEKMNAVGIYSQACFVLGFPGEEYDDRELTRQMIQRMTKNGLSEIAIFIITPIPGSNLYGKITGHKSYSELNFSPVWREDYNLLNEFRIALYREFLLAKFLFNFKSISFQPFRFLLRKFKTKMEMTPYRALVVFLRIKLSKVHNIY